MANYLRIVGRVLAVTKRVVLQLQYRPSIAVEVEDPSYFGVYRAIDAGEGREGGKGGGGR